MKLRRFTIKRSEWGRSRNGRAAIGTLFDPRSKAMCCLGFFCNQIVGIPKEAMALVGNSVNLENRTEKERLLASSVPVSRLIRLNDREDAFRDLEDGEQERLIAEAFLEAGYEAVFED